MYFVALERTGPPRQELDTSHSQNMEVTQVAGPGVGFVYQLLRHAWNLRFPRGLRETRPLALLMAEDIQQIGNRAAHRCVSAD